MFHQTESGDLLDCAVEAKIVEKAGSWYSFEGDRIGQGRENVKAYLDDNPEVMNKIEGMLLDSIKPVSDEDVADIMDMLIDEDGVVIE